MKIRTRIIALAVSILVLSALICQMSFAVDDPLENDENQVTIDSNKMAIKGRTYTGYVYIESLENIASLNVSIHYDSNVVKILNTYNRRSCMLYDRSISSDTLSYSYIFNADGQNTKALLFYFTYSVVQDAESSDSWFDVTVDEAYDFELNSTDVSGSRFKFSIEEPPPVTKRCSVTSASSLSTKAGEEIELLYTFNTTQIASGNVEIRYDKDLFEFVSLTNLGFLDNKIVDVNSSVAGTIFVSFLGTEYSNSREFMKIRLRTIGNEKIESDISFSESTFYDLNLDSIYCSGFSSKVSMVYDSNYDDSIPKISLTPNYDSDTNQLTLLVSLSSNSKLGAGDFVLSWNKDYFTYVSSTKKFTPSFFNVNDKLVSDGQLKFSIISLTDIIDSKEVIEVVFYVTRPKVDTYFLFEITGSGLSDSLTNPIQLNFMNTNPLIPGKNILYGDVNGDGKVNGKDATRLLQYLAHWDNLEIDLDASDVNGDGKVNGKDATRLLQYLAHWDVVLGS